ncbi:pilus assembly protein [Vibrio sp. SS-MA-C1-2]|uniref:TadE/TadG family type IV pilus assembly protein n=1 Tax=Vibrio sp. SS-MA-C1-2 TaxID=2908646 RepID=UPI001F35F604|nr:TadE/TadG family type IV pilus assembly protein [Vibrio sp. SS-MA-C1-2]UJF17512.1 pilus assembly protein [Vibrio sp. SS-MA-C1-2]
MKILSLKTVRQRQRQRKNKSDQQGVVAIEFALGFPLLILAIMGIFELCRFVFIVNLTETALSESSRLTKVYEGQYGSTYDERLQDVFTRDNELWNMMVQPENFVISMKQYPDIDALTNTDFDATSCDRCPLVMYEVSYDYSPLYISTGFTDSKIVRKVLSVQEHEGWSDEDES